MKKILCLGLALALIFNPLFVVQAPLSSFVYAQQEKSPNAQDIYEMMGKLKDPSIPKIEKERLTAVIFVHQDVYRRGVVDKIVPADDASVQAFLTSKNNLQKDVARRMNTNYRNQTGANLSEPIVPFPYNDIYSDDDLIVGSGSKGKQMESLYAESLDQVIRERAGRPMSALDRSRIDVNGMAWNMTTEGGIDNFWNKEKYINPQSGQANIDKLTQNPDTLEVIKFDANGNMQVLRGKDAANNFVKSFNVEEMLDIPGIEKGLGTGAMSDYLRMANIHKIDFNKALTKEDIIQFIRNQKYSQRLIDVFEKVALEQNPELASRYKQFMEVSQAIRNQKTALDLARVLENAYGVKIIRNVGGKDVVNFESLSKAMSEHQQTQLAKALPDLFSAASRNEAFKIVEWLKSQPLGSQARKKLRKQLALTYAPLDEKYVNSVLADINKLDVDQANKVWLVKAIDEDSKMIRQYAEVVGMPTKEFVRTLSPEGPSSKVVEWLESADKQVKVFTHALDAQPGGKKFKDFLRSKTAQALNLDVMLDGTKQGKIMSWSILILAVGRAYGAAGEEESKWKAMGMALFEIIPFVSATLRFSEMEYKEAFKQLAMDVFPPLVLADIAVAALHYTASSVRDSFTEAVWDGLTREALRDFSDSDFEKTDTGYWRLKDRASYLNYLEEVEPGFGRVAKLAPMVAAQVDALMDRNPGVQTNNAALYTLQWFEKFDEKVVIKRYLPEDIEQLRKKVWEKGLLAQGQAKNVERVAASILLDNLRIRSEIYKNVLDGFIDRIEHRYNLLKGQSDRECEGGMIKSTLGLGNDLCGASSIISNAQLILKQIYEETKVKMKDSDWGIPKLNEGYRQRLDVMMNYKIAGKTEMGVRQDMQRIIDDFREFVRLLLIAVELEKELRVLQLGGYIYGGGESFEPTEEVMLGDEFRIGAFARIQPKRAGLKWTLYYYLEDQSGNIKLLDKVSLSPQEFNPGTEGLWEIKHPEKKTFLSIKRAKLEPDFEKEGTYSIYPVLAYGNWGKDPVSQLGLYNLQNPLEAPELFKDNLVAFAGTAVSFSLVRPKIKAKMSSFVYKNESAELKFYLEAPKYAKDENFSAGFESNGPSEVAFDPKTFDKVSLNKEKPSLVNIGLAKEAKAGVYPIKIKVEMKSTAEKFQPLPHFKEFQYLDESNPEKEESISSAQGPLAQLQDLEKKAQALVDQAKEIRNNLGETVKVFLEKVHESVRAISDIEKTIKDTKISITDAENKTEKINQYAISADKKGKELANLRGEIEKRVLACCQVAQKISNAQGAPSVFNALFKDARSASDQAKVSASKFSQKLGEIKADLETAKNLFESVSKAKAKQDRLSGSLKNQGESFEALKAELTNIQSQVQGDANLKGEMKDIVSQAKEILGLAQTANEGASLLKQLQKACSAIEKKESIMLNYLVSGHNLVKGPQEKFNALEKKYNSLKATIATDLKSLLEKDFFSSAEDHLKDIQATYDTVSLYKDAVDNILVDLDKCMLRVNNPQAHISRMDCSAYPGTRPKWNKENDGFGCYCDKGYTWDKNKNQCLSQKEYELTNYNCDKYPNAQIYWDEKEGKSKCGCKPDYEWNNAATACRVKASIQVAQANCSSYFGTSPAWDNSSETVKCYCPPGQNWDSLSNSCITPAQAPPEDYFQPQQTTENPPNLFEDLPHIEKPVVTQEPPQTQDSGYQDSGYGLGGIENQPDSEGYYSSGTGKGAFYDKLRQQGLMKDPQGSTTGLSDVTVNKNQVNLSVWDNSTEDLDRVDIYLNGGLVISNLTIRNQPQNFTLYLKPGSNTLTVKALNIGDPEINKRLNMSPYNSAAVSISGVSVGKSSQSWKLSENQSASMTIEYRQ